jgi:hypothetical protein
VLPTAFTEQKQGCQQQNTNNIRDTNTDETSDICNNRHTKIYRYFFPILEFLWDIDSPTRRAGESGCQQLPNSPSLGVVDSMTHRLTELGSGRLSDSSSRGFLFKNSLADSPTRRGGESLTPRFAKSVSR